MRGRESQESDLDLRGVELLCTRKPPGKGTVTQRLETRLWAGCHAVVVDSEDQADAFILTCSGLMRAHRGHPQIAGESPYSSPKIRAAVVSLLSNEMVLDDGHRQHSVANLFARLRDRAPRSQAQPTRTVLPETLSNLKDRHAALLENHERRQLMLELALCHSAPKLALFYEPWSVIGGGEFPEQRLLGEVQRLVDSGCVVVLLSVSQIKAERYSSQVLHPTLRGGGKPVVQKRRAEVT